MCMCISPRSTKFQPDIKGRVVKAQKDPSSVPSSVDVMHRQASLSYLPINMSNSMSKDLDFR